MAKKRKTSPNPSSALVLRVVKQEVNRKAGDLIENVLKPKHIQPPPTGHQLMNDSYTARPATIRIPDPI